MLVDLARIRVIAGPGGNGCVSFRREKYVPKGGPDGGDGGHGGSVTFEVNPHIRTLLDFREKPKHQAQSGRPGQGANKTGKDGDDLLIHVPPGTVVRDPESGEVLVDMVGAGQQWIAAQGGRGGRGNARFATATHQAPRRADPGEVGQERWLELELKLIADVGLVGPPNAGKSTLLSRITRAHPRVAAYPFTTLEPHLGIVALDQERRFVVADLPGLIEDAHMGKGLGLEFLRHVERTRVLVMMVAADSADPAGDLSMVRNELAEYRETLGEKPSVVIFTKADILPPEQHDDAVARSGLDDALLVSSHSGLGIDTLLERLWVLVTAADATHEDGPESHEDDRE